MIGSYTKRNTVYNGCRYICDIDNISKMRNEQLIMLNNER